MMNLKSYNSLKINTTNIKDSEVSALCGYSPLSIRSTEGAWALQVLTMSACRS